MPVYQVPATVRAAILVSLAFLSRRNALFLLNSNITHSGSHAREERGGAKLDKTRYIFISGSRVRSQIMRRATVKIERELKSQKICKRQEKKERQKEGGRYICDVWNDVWTVGHRLDVSALVFNIGEDQVCIRSPVLASAKFLFTPG